MGKVKEICVEIAIIVITATAHPGMEESLKRQGAQVVFFKPVDLGSLRNTIQKIIHQKSSQ